MLEKAKLDRLRQRLGTLAPGRVSTQLDTQQRAKGWLRYRPSLYLWVSRDTWFQKQPPNLLSKKLFTYSVPLGWHVHSTHRNKSNLGCFSHSRLPPGMVKKEQLPTTSPHPTSMHTESIRSGRTHLKATKSKWSADRSAPWYAFRSTDKVVSTSTVDQMWIASFDPRLWWTVCRGYRREITHTHTGTLVLWFANPPQV